MSAHTDHEASLRAALHAAAESLEPRSDGLERIRARLRQPRSVSARLRAVCAEIIMRAPAWLQDVVYQVADWLRLVSERFAPAQAPGKHRSRAQGLLRPAAAMAVVMFIVAAGTYVAIDASTAIFPSSSNSQPGGGSNTGGHSGAPAPHSSHPSGTQSAAGSGHPATSPSCKQASPKPSKSSAPAPAQQSPSASPTSPATSASPDASTSPTTTPDASAAPSITASPNPPTQPASSPSIGLQPKPSPSC